MPDFQPAWCAGLLALALLALLALLAYHWHLLALCAVFALAFCSVFLHLLERDGARRRAARRWRLLAEALRGVRAGPPRSASAPRGRCRGPTASAPAS